MFGIVQKHAVTPDRVSGVEGEKETAASKLRNK